MKLGKYLIGMFLYAFLISGCPQDNKLEIKTVVISAPGPHNISYLPVDLIPAIGADAQEGVKLRIIHTGGGAVAMHNMLTRNADFAVAGVPAAMSLRSNGGDVVVIAPVDGAPLFVLMVRAALKNSVKRIADLKGKVIGVNTSTKHSKTTSQQLAELFLKSDGVPLNAVRIVPAGQSWIEQSSLILSGQADAVVGDEPFASRLLANNQVFFLAHLAKPETITNIKGVGFLHAALETRADVIRYEPDKVAKMVRMIKQSLLWIKQHTATEVVDILAIEDPQERSSLIFSLTAYPNAFSADGIFSTAQLRETDIFFRSGLESDDTAAQSINIENMIDDRWAGRVP